MPQVFERACLVEKMQDQRLMNTLWPPLKPYKDAAPKHTPLRADTEHAIIGVNSVGNVEKVSRVDDRLGVDRYAECRQVLRHHHAQARVIDREAALKRVDGKNRCFG